MNCPNCHAENVHRSRRRGPWEGMALRLKHQAPYRCPECGLRFIARVEAVAGPPVPRQLSIAEYLGLTGRSRQRFTDPMILGGLTVLLLLVMIVLIFALAFGWIDPRFLPARRPA